MSSGGRAGWITQYCPPCAQWGPVRIITPDEAAKLARVVEIFVRAVETSDFEKRLKQLEEASDAGA